MARVIIPENVDAFITLVSDIITKEQSLGPNGNLTPAELAQLEQLRNDGKKASDEQKAAYKKAEELTITRDNLLGTGKKAKVNQPGTALYQVTALRDILLAKNKTNPKVLGEWGFEVDDSPKAGDEPTPPAP